MARPPKCPKGCVPVAPLGAIRDTTIWAYHATSKKALPSIMKHGLDARRQPRRHRGEDRCYDGDALFFSPAERFAGVWGDVMLRFPWPDEAYEDEYSDMTIVDGEVLASNWYMTDGVEPAQIQVKTATGWKPLRHRA